MGIFDNRMQFLKSRLDNFASDMSLRNGILTIYSPEQAGSLRVKWEVNCVFAPSKPLQQVTPVGTSNSSNGTFYIREQHLPSNTTPPSNPARPLIMRDEGAGEIPVGFEYYFEDRKYRTVRAYADRGEISNVVEEQGKVYSVPED